MTGYFPSLIGRNPSARSTRPSSMVIGTSQSVRMPSRVSERWVMVSRTLPHSGVLPSSPRAKRVAGGGGGGGGVFSFRGAPPPPPPPPPPRGGGGAAPVWGAQQQWHNRLPPPPLLSRATHP